jgi:DNA polymerase-3 subunit epsilon
MPSIFAPRQRSFDDLEVPLRDVTFCAVDLETTSGSWRDGEIVEIGAIRSRGGEVLGTFQSFVRPSIDLPVEIQMLTGITPHHLADAPPLPVVLPSFIEFCGRSVFVAHNARFDRSFIDVACRRLDYEISSAPIVDTVRLARRILRNEVRSCGLRALSTHLRTEHKPCHRAFEDAAACLEVLWALLERVAAYGVTTLADLIEIQSVRSNPHFEKVKLARELPTTRGVYLFENARREVIYVGKAANLRARVRSYFTHDERKRMADLRAEIANVRAVHCETEPHAAGLEARLIERYQPRYNRAGKRRKPPVYLRLTNERHARLAIARSARDDGSVYIGPFSSQQRARAAATTLSGLFGLRTCTLRLGGETHAPCALYTLGSCHGPCTGNESDVASHDRAVRSVRRDIDGGLVLARDLLARRLSHLCEQARFEEASEHRDAFNELARAVDRARRLTALRDAGRVELSTPDGTVTLDEGRLVDAEEPCPADHGLALAAAGLGERQAIASWFERAHDVRIVAAERPLAFRWPRTAPLERIELFRAGGPVNPGPRPAENVEETSTTA